MALATHGDRKYQATTQLLSAAQFTKIRVERRLLEPGYHEPGTCQSNELAFVLSGATVSLQSANDVTYRRFIQPGTSCICPVGTFEKASGTTSPIECLHIYLPPRLIERSAIADYDIDPSKAELLYTGALKDPKLYQIAMTFSGILAKDVQPADHLFVSGMQAALAAYLLEKYSVDRWRPPTKRPELESKRLKRVLDYIDAHFAYDVTLDDLATEAGLSDFHFSRSFRETLGVSPHRYLTLRRVQEAQMQLERTPAPLSDIALTTGFGSPANFAQVFRNVTGMSPAGYRSLRKK